MCRHEKLMKFTIKQAQKNPTKMNHKLAATIAYGSWVVAIGNNHWKSFDNSIHAEVHAIRCATRTLKELDNSTIYVARVCKTKIGLAKPCVDCFSQLVKFGIKKIMYTITSSFDKPKWVTITL